MRFEKKLAKWVARNLVYRSVFFGKRSNSLFFNSNAFSHRRIVARGIFFPASAAVFLPMPMAMIIRAHRSQLLSLFHPLESRRYVSS